MSKLQSFSITDAELYGIECAILIDIIHFLSKHKEFVCPEKPFDRVWINLNPTEIHFICPYWKPREIELYLMKLVMDEVLTEELTWRDGKEYYAFKEEKSKNKR